MRWIGEDEVSKPFSFLGNLYQIFDIGNAIGISLVYLVLADPIGFEGMSNVRPVEVIGIDVEFSLDK